MEFHGSWDFCTALYELDRSSSLHLSVGCCVVLDRFDKPIRGEGRWNVFGDRERNSVNHLLERVNFGRLDYALQNVVVGQRRSWLHRCRECHGKSKNGNNHIDRCIDDKNLDCHASWTRDDSLAVLDFNFRLIHGDKRRQYDLHLHCDDERWNDQGGDADVEHLQRVKLCVDQHFRQVDGQYGDFLAERHGEGKLYGGRGDEDCNQVGYDQSSVGFIIVNFDNRS